jgi:hypothetical protein
MSVSKIPPAVTHPTQAALKARPKPQQAARADKPEAVPAAKNGSGGGTVNVKA